MAISWKTDIGVNHVGAYQVSGKPFAKGNINALTATKVEFPKVTRWIYVVNNSGNDLKLGFSEAGVEGSDYVLIGQKDNQKQQSTVRLEVKVSEIWLSGSNPVSLVAGLTNIDPARISGSAGPSWSGSSGVG